jgi:hypothetical protein
MWQSADFLYYTGLVHWTCSFPATSANGMGRQPPQCPQGWQAQNNLGNLWSSRSAASRSRSIGASSFNVAPSEEDNESVQNCSDGAYRENSETHASHVLGSA